MTSFHVRHDFNPVVARDALLLLRALGESDESTFLENARSRDFEIGRRQSALKVFTSLQDLGLLERPDDKRGVVRLTCLGTQFAEMTVRDTLLLGELIHLRYWWLWAPTREGKRFSWAYRAVAENLWEEAPATIDSSRIVATVLSQAEHQFGTQGVSFSSSSVLGILHWIRALRPSCIIGDQFRPRLSCPPEAFVLALEGAHASSGHTPNVPIRIDSAIRSRVCRALLLDSTAFDDTLTLAEDSLGVVRRRSDIGELVLVHESLVPGLIP